jgi:hypothetical protein
MSQPPINRETRLAMYDASNRAADLRTAGRLSCRRKAARRFQCYEVDRRDDKTARNIPDIASPSSNICDRPGLSAGLFVGLVYFVMRVAAVHIEAARGRRADRRTLTFRPTKPPSGQNLGSHSSATVQRMASPVVLTPNARKLTGSARLDRMARF